MQPNLANSKVLAIDWGDKKIGLAYCDLSNGVILPKGIVSGKNLGEILANIFKLVIEQRVNLVLFGLPLNFEGEGDKSAERIRGFAEKLRLMFEKVSVAVKIDFVDEGYSTFEAKEMMSEIGEHHKIDDDLAAMIILKRYLKTI